MTARVTVPLQISSSISSAGRHGPGFARPSSSVPLWQRRIEMWTKRNEASKKLPRITPSFPGQRASSSMIRPYESTNEHGWSSSSS